MVKRLLLIVALFCAVPSLGQITYRDSTPTTDFTGSGTFTLLVPALTQSGDAMIALIGERGATPACPTPPSGWTLIQCTANGSATTFSSAYFRIATGSEPASYMWTLAGATAGVSGAITSYSGADQTSPINASSSLLDATPPDPDCTVPSLTTTVPNTLVIATCLARPLSTGSTLTATPPAGYTERWDVNIPGGFGSATHGNEWSDIAQVAAGASGAQLVTWSGGTLLNTTSIAIAIAPDAGTPTHTFTLTPTNTQLPTYTPRPFQPGQEIQANTYTSNSQAFPQIGVSEGTDDFVVVWSSQLQDGSFYGVFGQRYASAGTAVGAEFQINTYTTGGQVSSTVAMTSNGGFIVSWISESGLFSFDGDIIARRGALASGMLGSEFVVNTYTTFNQAVPNATTLTTGDVIIVWESGDSFGNTQDGSEEGVFGRRFTSTGTAIGGEFQVNTYTTRTQRRSGIAAQAGGEFVVVWASEDQSGFPGAAFDVFGQRFDSTGAKIGTDFQVNTVTTGTQSYYPSIDAASDGSFVVAWYQTDMATDFSVHARQFTSSGTPVGAPFSLPSGTETIKAHPRVCVEDDGTFAAMWLVFDSVTPVDGDTANLDIGQRVRRFAPNGTPTTSDFSLNSYREYVQQGIFSGIYCNNSRLLAAWTSARQDGDAGNAAPVIAALLGAPVAEGAVEFDVFTFPTSTPTSTATPVPTATLFPTPIRHVRGDLKGQAWTLASNATCATAECHTVPLSGRLGTKSIIIRHQAGAADYEVTCGLRPTDTPIGAVCASASCIRTFSTPCEKVAVYIDNCAACQFTIKYNSTGDL